MDEAFVIVDERLRVQAVSIQAEDVLMVADPDGLGAPLASYLVSDDDRDPSGAQLSLRITFAVGGRSAPGALKLRTAGTPEIRFRGRVSSCGPPAGALLVLTPVDGHERAFGELDRQQSADGAELNASVSLLIPRKAHQRRAS